MNWMLIFQSVSAVSASGLFLTLLTVWLKTRPDKHRAQTERLKLKSESDASLRADLLARIAALEAKVEAQDGRLEHERQECDRRIDRQEERHCKAMSEVKKEFSLMRHDRNNLKQAFGFLITTIKKSNIPAMREIAEAAEEMLARGEAHLAMEKGAAAPERLM